MDTWSRSGETLEASASDHAGSVMTSLESVNGEDATRPDSPLMQRVTDKRRQDPAWAMSAGGPAELVIGGDDDDDDDNDARRQPTVPQTKGKQQESKVHGRSAALEAMR